MPALEPRLQRRYVHLVNEHLRGASPLTAGPAALPRLISAFASTQAAWRFFANDSVSLSALVEPLQTAGRSALDDSPADYALLVHDWSILNYHRHTSKTDQLLFSHNTVHATRKPQPPGNLCLPKHKDSGGLWLCRTRRRARSPWTSRE